MIGNDGNKSDRALGEYWEDRFIEIARSYGWEAWPFNRVRGATFRDMSGNQYISPDIWLLKRKKKQFICEIKHKNAAKNGCYGFELYREESMLSIEDNYQNRFGRVEALYIVHDHDLAGGKNELENNVLHWHAERLLLLSKKGYEGQPQLSYYNGVVSDKPMRIKYYPRRLFQPIRNFLA